MIDGPTITQIADQKLLDGVETMLAAGLVLAGAVTNAWWFLKCVKDDECRVLGALITVVLIVMSFLLFINGLDLTVNPAYWATCKEAKICQ